VFKDRLAIDAHPCKKTEKFIVLGNSVFRRFGCGVWDKADRLIMSDSISQFIDVVKLAEDECIVVSVQLC